MVCQNCGKSLVRGYSFCMECGSPVPPEALEEAGMPPRTGDHAENPHEKSPKPTADSTGTTRASGGMPDISPLSAGDNDDSEVSSEKSLVFCKNCGTVMQSNPYTCEKCGEPLAGGPGGIPLFRDPDLLSERMEDIGEDMNLSEMLGVDGSPLDDEIDAEAAKMFGVGSETHSNINSGSQFSAADLEMLNMQMSKYSQSTSSEMPMVGRDMPEPEPPKPPQPPKPVDKNAPIIAEEEFIPESNDFGDFGDFTEESSDEIGAFVEPMQSNPVDLDKPHTAYPEPKPEVSNPMYPEPKPIPESPVIEQAPIIEEAPVIEEISENPPDSANADIDDYLLPPEELPPPEKQPMPRYMFFGIIIVILCITAGIILANAK
ncbi:MAG: hypothetical protein K2N06_02755 [Oscillospiraceae bacterium]|nr:hypothetical protein [Oscillospiraceae bacterium]